MNCIQRIGFITALTATFAGGAEQDLTCYETQPTTGTSLAVACSGRALLYTSQLFGDSGQSAAQQARDLLARMTSLLRDSGYADAQPLRLEWVLAPTAGVADLHRALRAEFGGPHKPAVSVVQGRLPRPGVAFALNGIYALLTATKLGKAEVKYFGPAAVATLPAGGTTYVSGQATQGTNTLDSARRTLGSLMRTLDFLKLKPEDVVQFKVFLQPIAETAPVLAALEEIYGRKQAMPPVVFVEWLGQPSLEIEMVVASPATAGAASIEYLTPPGMTASPVYCRVARVNAPDRVFFSTLTAAADGDGKAQGEDICGQLGRLLTATGSGFQHLAKATYYVSDDLASKALNELRPRYYDPQRPPAASKALVLGTAIPGRTMALDLIAVPARQPR